LLFIEHKNGKLNPGTLSALTAAQNIGGDIVGLVTGDAEGDSVDVIAKAAKR
jgi:electron transfer flavoprotein alpha subunit